ncbi:MAG: YwmB family TATA-box binding protein [Tissierellia bacterium]|nr:YwmB family TATA-box binding protein [Tissierellia bacterium]
MKRIIIFAIIVFLLVPTFSVANTKYSENDVLTGILKEFKGKFLEGEINIGGVILDEFISKEKIKEIGKEIKDELELIGEELDQNRGDLFLEGKYYLIEEIYEEGFNHLIIYGYSAEQNPVTIMLSSYFSPEINIGETTLFINVIKDEKNFNINGIIGSVENIFRSFGKTAEITTCVIGTVDGKLDYNYIEKYANNALKKFKGKVVEKYTDPMVTSYTVYTPYIENYIFSLEKRVNLNLAIRYNEYENQTYIWIGTPIITTGY